MSTDTSPIVLEKVDIQVGWNKEVDDVVFIIEDLEYVDQVDREAKAVAMAKEKARAQGDPMQDLESESDGFYSDDKDYEVEYEDEDDHDEHVTEVQP